MNDGAYDGLQIDTGDAFESIVMDSLGVCVGGDLHDLLRYAFLSGVRYLADCIANQTAGRDMDDVSEEASQLSDICDDDLVDIEVTRIAAAFARSNEVT